MSTQLRELVQYLDQKIPLQYQESYDNAGLLIGNPKESISGVLITLDVTEAVIDEAIAKKCNVIVAHHPLIFKPLKRLIGKGYVENTIIKAI
ncbi:MAG: Nif3-like dinuclear metal center hexameric protein, partial [Cytophagales bacterium]|nr:Nif3-like dinuclear metal center hexameric protein [Cytophagales bacterium]